MIESDRLFSKKYALQFFLTMVGFVLSLALFNWFARFVEARPGAVIRDPLLAALPVVDLTWIIFLIIYLSLAIALVELRKHPRQFLYGIQVYIYIAAARVITIFLTPLDPPAGMIFLRDPIVEFLASQQKITRDLFFSGHTATVFLFFLAVESKSHKKFFLAATGLVGASLLLQHVHYTSDVIVAPFFTYGCYRLVGLIRKQLSQLGSPVNLVEPSL